MRIAFAIPFALLLHSCSGTYSDATKTGSTPPTAEEKEFTEIVNGIPTVELPRRLEYWKGVDTITNAKTLEWTHQFWKTNEKGVWGRVFVDQPNVHLLATRPDDLGTVFLVTFDKFGKLLSEESLQRGLYVSADPQYLTNNYSTLHPDMRLVEIDSLFKYPYDEEKNDRLEGDEMCQVTNHEYKIGPDGTLKIVRYDTTDFFKTGYRSRD